MTAYASRGLWMGPLRREIERLATACPHGVSTLFLRMPLAIEAVGDPRHVASLGDEGERLWPGLFRLVVEREEDPIGSGAKELQVAQGLRERVELGQALAAARHDHRRQLAGL